MEQESGNQPSGSSQQPLLPSFQVQIPIPGQQQSSNVQVLAETIKESTKEGNSSEAQVALQIILISSAILAIVGGFTLSGNSAKLGLATGILFIFAIMGLGSSLFAGVLHFVTERRFWYGNRQRGIAAFRVIQTIPSLPDKERAALQALSDFSEGSSRIAFWIQIASFAAGIFALLILVGLRVVTHI